MSEEASRWREGGLQGVTLKGLVFLAFHNKPNLTPGTNRKKQPASESKERNRKTEVFGGKHINRTHFMTRGKKQLFFFFNCEETLKTRQKIT